MGGFKIEERHSKCLDSIGDPCCRKRNPGHRGLLRAPHIFEARIERAKATKITGGRAHPSATSQEVRWPTRSSSSVRLPQAIADVPAAVVRARSFFGTNLGLNEKTAERDILARADKDFERLFGAD